MLSLADFFENNLSNEIQDCVESKSKSLVHSGQNLAKNIQEFNSEIRDMIQKKSYCRKRYLSLGKPKPTDLEERRSEITMSMDGCILYFEQVSIQNLLGASKI